MSASSPKVKPAQLMKADDWQFVYQQKTDPKTSNLDILTYGMYRLAAKGASDELFHRQEETILFCMSDQQIVEVAGETFTLNYYDTLYIPLATPYHITNNGEEESMLIVCRALAENKHAPHHAVWKKIQTDETRIRHLDGKDVFLMFDVTEQADRLLAGYTIYEPHTRAWPPHNHTDQEEVYIFTQGTGAMEVYEDEQNKTFVHSMNLYDAATIPLLNFHPVFSQEDELHFIWCLAGERYWIGDKHEEFMDASVDEITT